MAIMSKSLTVLAIKLFQLDLDFPNFGFKKLVLVEEIT
jgi:hypothetical protein